MTLVLFGDTAAFLKSDGSTDPVSRGNAHADSAAERAAPETPIEYCIKIVQIKI